MPTKYSGQTPGRRRCFSPRPPSRRELTNRSSLLPYRKPKASPIPASTNGCKPCQVDNLVSSTGRACRTPPRVYRQMDSLHRVGLHGVPGQHWRRRMLSVRNRHVADLRCPRLSGSPRQPFRGEPTGNAINPISQVAVVKCKVRVATLQFPQMVILCRVRLQHETKASKGAILSGVSSPGNPTRSFPSAGSSPMPTK